MPPVPRTHPHLPPGRLAGPLTRDHPLDFRGAIPSLMSPELKGVTVLLPRTEYRRGQTVSVEASPARDGLEAGLVCGEYYLDYRAPDGPSSVLHPEWEEWQPADSGTVHLDIPADAPYSHEGTHLAVIWAVVVRLPRRLRADPNVRVPIWVDP